MEINDNFAIALYNTLKAFADLYHSYHDGMSSIHPVFTVNDDRITVGDLRNAKFLLQVLKEKIFNERTNPTSDSNTF